MSAKELENEIALVPGASRGIGLAIALELGRQGATVIGTATSNDGASKIGDTLKAEGIKGQGLVLNVTDQGSIDTALTEIHNAWGAPGILVNNAGILRDNLLMRMKDEEWDELLDTNLKSVFRMSKVVRRGMTKRRKGRIVNISSLVGSSGNAGQCNYAAAKAGVMGFTRSLAREVGSRNITVNAVAPGFIDTDMARTVTEAQRAAVLPQIPLGRLGLAEEVAHAVGFLASPRAAYITGATLHIHGGMYMI